MLEYSSKGALASFTILNVITDTTIIATNPAITNTMLAASLAMNPTSGPSSTGTVLTSCIVVEDDTLSMSESTVKITLKVIVFCAKLSRFS